MIYKAWGLVIGSLCVRRKYHLSCQVARCAFNLITIIAIIKSSIFSAWSHHKEVAFTSSHVNATFVLCIPVLSFSSGQRNTLPPIQPSHFAFFITLQNDLFRSNFARENWCGPGAFVASGFPAGCSKIRLRSRRGATLAWLGAPPSLHVTTWPQDSKALRLIDLKARC